MQIRIALAFLAVIPALAQPSAAPFEHGKFRLHKFEQPIGEETYQIQPDGASLAATVDFKFTDRSTAVPLTVSFRGAAVFTRQAFARDRWTEIAAPARFFTIAGYAPTTMQMLLVRYWSKHGSPAELATLPSGRVKILSRGKDEIAIDGKKQTLARYSVEGLIWGRETLWFDAQLNLVAAVTTDAEFDHFEAIREGFESGLATFVSLNGWTLTSRRASG